MTDVRQIHTVEVPTEDGRKAVIDVVYDLEHDVYSFRVAGPLLDQTPEAVTVAIQMTVLELRALRLDLW